MATYKFYTKFNEAAVINISILLFLTYRDADKSLARPGKKQATFPAFYGTWSFITIFTRVHHLSLP